MKERANIINELNNELKKYFSLTEYCILDRGNEKNANEIIIWLDSKSMNQANKIPKIFQDATIIVEKRPLVHSL